MKLTEIVTDDQLYDIWSLVTDAIWKTLIDNYSDSNVYEGYAYRRNPAPRMIYKPVIRRPAKLIKRPPPRVPIKPFPKRPELNQVKKSSIPPSQTTGSNPKVDRMNGPEFKMNNGKI